MRVIAYILACVTITTIKMQRYHPKTVLPLYSHVHPFPPLLNPDSSSALHLHNYVISQMLHKWDKAGCFLLKLAF